MGTEYEYPLMLIPLELSLLFSRRISQNNILTPNDVPHLVHSVIFKCISETAERAFGFFCMTLLFVFTKKIKALKTKLNKMNIMMCFVQVHLEPQ